MQTQQNRSTVMAATMAIQLVIFDASALLYTSTLLSAMHAVLQEHQRQRWHHVPHAHEVAASGYSICTASKG